jgi:hypothetical protein
MPKGVRSSNRVNRPGARRERRVVGASSRVLSFAAGSPCYTRRA